ncbi:MAG: CehA/McbA family metallohydrolase [Candidatus Bipolaricaulia bacterium]
MAVVIAEDELKIEQDFFARCCRRSPDHRLPYRFTPDDHQKHFQVRFRVAEGTQTLVIRADFEPKAEPDRAKDRERIIACISAYVNSFSTEVRQAIQRRFQTEKLVDRLSPIRNLINFSIFDPSGRFRGRGETRFMGSPLLISTDYASLGFLVGPLEAGDWTVEISTHAIVTERCELELDVWGVHEPVPKRRRPERTAAARSPQSGDGERWLAGELHAHSHHSDGAGSVAELANLVKARPVDFLVLTDHNTISGYPELEEVADPLMIPGMELTTFFGHAVAIGIDRYIAWTTIDRSDPLTEKIRAVHDQGGLFGIAHPNIIGTPICTGCAWEYDGVDLHQVDLIEIWSGSWREQWFANRKTIRWWDELVSSGYRLVGVGGTDIHEYKAKPDHPTTYVRARTNSREAILEGLRSGSVYISSGPGIRFEIGVADRTLGIGDRAAIEPGTEAKVSITPSGCRGDERLVLVRNGEPIHAAEVSGLPRLSFIDRPQRDSYYRCEIVDRRGDLQLITNPISLLPRI